MSSKKKNLSHEKMSFHIKVVQSEDLMEYYANGL
jgi:hypothetical protein